MIVALLSTIGELVSSVATSGCLFGWIDEPEMPKSLIQK